MRQFKHLLLFTILVTLVLAGCGARTPASTSILPAEAENSEPAEISALVDTPYTVEIDPADFVDVIDNPYFPRIVGTKYVYEGQTEAGLERIELEILPETKEVMGITATVMRDKAYVAGELVEDTFDWFAQDKDGNVWYLGEDVSNYENGELVDKDGSWEAGLDGALPGIIMFANPAAYIGQSYRQEYYAGKAEDVADVLSDSESLTVPYGSFDSVVQTKDYTPLEPGVLEHKFYAAGIGVIKTVNLNTGEEVVLVEFVPAVVAGPEASETVLR